MDEISLAIITADETVAFRGNKTDHLTFNTAGSDIFLIHKHIL
ncbi:hypothetical protein PQBR44_0033 (plasmid) [Pseudomonas putida UWC1]|nr:hypothetical protein PQBR44_0033 [Pseudomonas putida UWC1]